MPTPCEKILARRRTEHLTCVVQNHTRRPPSAADNNFPRLVAAQPLVLVVHRCGRSYGGGKSLGFRCMSSMIASVLSVVPAGRPTLEASLEAPTPPLPTPGAPIAP